jgi:oligopeptidase B
MKSPGFDLSSPIPEQVHARRTTHLAHGKALIDDYGWLRAQNWQEVLKDPAVLPAEIRDVLERENRHADAVLAPTRALQKTLVKEMRGRIKEDDADVPESDGPFEYYDRFREGGEHELVCRRSRNAGSEEILLDGDALAKGKAFFEIGGAAISPDHKRLAWSADERGSEYYTIRVRDLASGADLPDVVEESDGEMVWSADGASFLYIRLDENHRPSRVYRRRLGQDPSTDELIFEETDPGWFMNVWRSRSRRFAIIHLTDHDSAEAHLLDLHDPHARLRLVAARESGLRYDVEHHGERLFIRTNADGCEDFKLVEAPLADPARINWRDVIPYRPGRMITRISAFQTHLVRLERENSLPQIIIRDIASGEEHAIAFDEEAYSLSLHGSREFASKTLRFAYSSMTTPEEIYDYDMTTRTRMLRKRQTIPSGHDPALYVTRRIFATAADGALVPISMLYKRDTPLDGSAPLFITGYGSYGHAYPASFSSRRLSLVDRGFVYAIAHVRGGTDKGWGWYKNGKLNAKPNTFADFIACARHLAAQAFTTEGHIVASGGSAGGMLMGAIANMAPELFAGVVADVPFVDVMNTMLDATLPLTPPEWLEWGDPINDPTAFDTMLSYSPYDNVKAQTYPAILALGGLTDPRVTYWEPAKWVARLRATMTGGGPVLLKTNMDAGHGGASGRFDSLKDTALEFAFAIAAIERARNSA